jgi:PAS domain S-box-containing protein
MPTARESFAEPADLGTEARQAEALLRTGALQRAIFNSANFSSIATDAKGVIQIFNVGAERMLGYAAAEVVNTITPADISDPQELIERATALSLELGASIAPGFDALVFKASRGIEDIYELTYIRKDRSRFPAVVSVTALRDAQDAIIGYLLIGTDNTARKQAEEALHENYALLRTIHLHSIVSVTDRAGVIVDANDGFCTISGYSRDELLGQTHRIVNSGVQSPAFWADMWRTIVAGLPWRGEICNRTKEGSLYWVDSIIAPFMSEDGRTKRYISVRTDVTARKQAEEALVKAGALQSAIFNSANFSSIATDAKGVIQIFNVGAERMLGYAAADMMNQITPADISDPQEVIARAKALSVELGTAITPGFEALVFKASRGIEDIYELTYIRKDGSRFPAVVSVTALRDAQDAIIGYLLIGTDNTARKQAEDALLKAGALQRAIFNSANFSSIATDAQGVIQIFNVGAERMLGYTAAQVVNRITPADLSDPRELIERASALSLEFATPIAPGFEALVFKASRGIEDIYEMTKLRKDGSRFPVVVSVTALRDVQDAIIGYLLIGTDNTARQEVEEERKKLDQRLRDQQFYTRSLIESNIDPLMTTDPRGIITDVNKQTEALTGCTRDELIGAPFKNYFTDPARAEAGIKRVLAEGKVTNYELTARARDGEETVVSYNATTFHDRDRRLQGVFASARDMTELKRFEHTLQQNEVQRERDAEHATELGVVNQELEAFSYSVSHDLRAPLRHIHGYVEMLRVATDGQLSDKATHYLNTITDASVEMGELIDDLLAFSRVGRAEIRGASVQLSGLVQDVIRGLEMATSGRHIVWRIGSLPCAVGDPSLIKQVFTNLIDNAVKYSRTREPATIEIGCADIDCAEEESGRMVLFVRDNGVGFDMQYAHKLFGVFQRLHRPEEFEGTGIGLATVRRIIGRHGGRVWAEGSVDQGATFYFTLERAPSA